MIHSKLKEPSEILKFAKVLGNLIKLPHLYVFHQLITK